MPDDASLLSWSLGYDQIKPKCVAATDAGMRGSTPLLTP